MAPKKKQIPDMDELGYYNEISQNTRPDTPTLEEEERMRRNRQWEDTRDDFLKAGRGEDSGTITQQRRDSELEQAALSGAPRLRGRVAPKGTTWVGVGRKIGGHNGDISLDSQPTAAPHPNPHKQWSNILNAGSKPLAVPVAQKDGHLAPGSFSPAASIERAPQIRQDTDPKYGGNPNRTRKQSQDALAASQPSAASQPPATSSPVARGESRQAYQPSKVTHSLPPNFGPHQATRVRTQYGDFQPFSLEAHKAAEERKKRLQSRTLSTPQEPDMFLPGDGSSSMSGGVEQKPLQIAAPIAVKPGSSSRPRILPFQEPESAGQGAGGAPHAQSHTAAVPAASQRSLVNNTSPLHHPRQHHQAQGTGTPPQKMGYPEPPPLPSQDTVASAAAPPMLKRSFLQRRPGARKADRGPSARESGDGGGGGTAAVALQRPRSNREDSQRAAPAEAVFDAHRSASPEPDAELLNKPARPSPQLAPGPLMARRQAQLLGPPPSGRPQVPPQESSPRTSPGPPSQNPRPGAPPGPPPGHPPAPSAVPFSQFLRQVNSTHIALPQSRQGPPEGTRAGPPRDPTSGAPPFPPVETKPIPRRPVPRPAANMAQQHAATVASNTSSPPAAPVARHSNVPTKQTSQPVPRPSSSSSSPSPTPRASSPIPQTKPSKPQLAPVNTSLQPKTPPSHHQTQADTSRLPNQYLIDYTKVPFSPLTPNTEREVIKKAREREGNGGIEQIPNTARRRKSSSAGAARPAAPAAGPRQQPASSSSPPRVTHQAAPLARLGGGGGNNTRQAQISARKASIKRTRPAFPPQTSSRSKNGLGGVGRFIGRKL